MGWLLGLLAKIKLRSGCGKEDGREIDFKGTLVRVSAKGRNQDESSN